jgi:Family of unknown function (DUF6345)
MSTRMGVLAGGAAGIVAMLWTGTADAGISVAGESMTSWSGCPISSPPSSLTYTNDQISFWLSKMQSLGHSRKYWYTNANVWASDFVEDSWGGQDNLYNDSVDFFALSSHGSSPDSDGMQYFSTPTCNAGTYRDARFNSWDASWDESPPNPLASPSSGWARFLMLLTCHGVDTRPNEQWASAVTYGNDVIMGYRGVSADSSTTDEVGEDLGEAAFNDGDTFKAAWFWAIEDWAVDDTGAIFFTGPTAAQCTSRRDGLRANWGRRGNVAFYYQCWSWHEG